MSAHTAVVTGGSGYLGGALVERLLDAGYRVINVSRSPAHTTLAKNILCDLADATATRAAAQQVQDSVGAVDVFIHAACPPTTRVALEDTPQEVCEREFAIAAGAAEIFADILLPQMKPGSSFIGITTASLDKDTPEKNIGVYLPAKAALRQLLNNLRSQWQDKGIQVLEVTPTFLPGGLNKDLPEGVRTILARQKDATVPTAESVAESVMQLIS